jgi:hypothetical protein
MSSRLMSTLALVFAAVVFAAPASAAVGGQAAAAAHPTRNASFYRDAQEAQRAESRLYETASTSSGGDTSALASVLVACVVMLAGSAALAAWRLNQNEFPARIAAVR